MEIVNGPTFQPDSNGEPDQPQSTPAVHVVPDMPPKRRPGRPKGSTKKNLATLEPAVPRVKRPVGRPRKDGFPAGSVGPSRVRGPKQAIARAAQRQQIQQPSPLAPPPPQPTTSLFRTWTSNDVHMTGVAYPPPMMTSFPAVMSAKQVPVPAPVPMIVDSVTPPTAEQDDWAVLAKMKPNVFLSTLLSAIAAPNPVSSAGPTVEEAFKSHLVSLAPNPSQMQSSIPSLYSILKTFWLPSSPAYFSLTASASTARTPSEHRFLYWDPQPLVFNGIACPSCSAPLQNRGRISTGPIKIYDIEKPFFVIGCEYVCTSPTCVNAIGSADGRRFASTDSSILRSLPVRLKDEFPAKLLYGDADAGSGPGIWNWKALGVSIQLWNMVKGCLKAGLKKDAILQIVKAVQHGVPEEESTPVHVPQLQPQQLHTTALPQSLQAALSQQSEQSAKKGSLSSVNVPDDTGGSEEDADADENNDQPSTAATSSQNSSQQSASDAPQNAPYVQNLFEAYNDAWKANSGITEVRNEGVAQQTPTTPTPIQRAQPQPPPSVSATQHFDFSKTYTLPYPTYHSFFSALDHATVPPGSTADQPSSVGAASPASVSQGYKRPYPGYSTSDDPNRGSATDPSGGASTTPTATAGPTGQPSASSSPALAPGVAQPATPSSSATPTATTTTVAGGTPSTTGGPKRNPRHCCKCGKQDCKGKGGRTFCANPCQDCGKLDCRGRNSRRPDKRCSEGWL